MPTPATIDELKKVIALSNIPDEHLQWILDRSEVSDFEDGATLLRTGDPAETLMFILAGKGDFYMDVNGTLVYYTSFENDKATGGITGLIPHSRMKTAPGTAFAVGRLRILGLHKSHFADLEKLNPELIQRMIGYMTERARTFATIQLQREKVSALGKLSAGIAHELNNPAAAISRISAELKNRLDCNYELTSKLLSTKHVSPEEIEKIRSFAKEKESTPGAKVSALVRMQAEDDIMDWFSDHGLNESREAAETFSEFGYSTEDLEALYKNIPPESFLDLLKWIENILVSDRLIRDLDEASGRISHLVGAIKSHVHMDRTNDVQRTNIHTDIENTLALMGYKMRDKNIMLAKNFSDTMPEVDAYVGELNQVWTNLIDNAIDAVEKNGSIEIQTSYDKKNATVRIIDNGSGIPKEIQSRIFDPFFTTKKVGEGTGIGLDTVKRIVDRHRGEIKVDSEPGRTEFSICIPLKAGEVKEK